jgi:hypothetical protein
MVKARRNRQPKPWDKMTQVRSHTSIIRGAEKIRGDVGKLEKQKQVCERRIAKTDSHLKALRREKGSCKDFERLAVLENKIRKQEKWLLQTKNSLVDIEERIIIRNKREQTALLTVRQEIATASRVQKEKTDKLIRDRELTKSIRSSDQANALFEQDAKRMRSTRLFEKEKPLGNMRTYVVKNSKGTKIVKRKWQDYK